MKRNSILAATCLALAGPTLAQGGPDCASAQVVGSLMSFPWTNVGDVTSGDGGLCYGVPASATGEYHHDVWFEWTAPQTGDFTITQNGFDGIIGVFDGNDCSTLVNVDCEDTPNGTSDEVTLFGAVATNSYLIVVGGWQPGVTGSGTVDIAQIGGPPIIGTNFCPSLPNSSGSAAVMGSSGTSSVAINNLVLSAAPCPIGQPGVFYYGPTALAGIPFGNGVRCVGGPGGTVVRIFPFVVTDGTGTMSTTIDNTNPVHLQVAPFMSLHFQCWFRDPAAGGSGFNLSDGYTIPFGI